MKIKRYGKFITRLGLSVLIILLIAVVFSRRDDLRHGRGSPPSPLVQSDDLISFGDITVHLTSREIRFHGEVRQAEGSVWLLLHLAGYQWLEEEAAIVSSARLIDLQQAIALLDWQLWDRLWLREGGEHDTGAEVLIGWDGDKVAANELIQTQYCLDIGDLIYLGSPFFDALFLTRCKQTVLCIALSNHSQCPLFILHETIEAKFVRGSGERGYHLIHERLPAVGTAVTVIIRVPYPVIRSG